MFELLIDPYVGVIKLTSGETIVATIQCLPDFAYSISDPLQMNMATIVTTGGSQMTYVAVPWMSNALDRTFIINESSVITIGEANPAVFENYMSIITSDRYYQEFTPKSKMFEIAPVKSETGFSNNPILKKFKNTLEQCFKL